MPYNTNPLGSAAQPGNTNSTIAYPPGQWATPGSAAPQTKYSSTQPVVAGAGVNHYSGEAQGALGGNMPGYGGGGGGRSSYPVQQGSASYPAASSPAPFVNNAQQDPNLTAQVGRINARLDNPEGSTGRAIDQATSGIRDANEGRRKAIKGMLSKRGVLSSSSIPEFSEANLMQQEGADVNKAASGIAIQRERDNDAFLLGSTDALAAPGNAARADRGLGNQQWQMAEQARQSADQAQVQNWMNSLSLINQLGGLGGAGGGGGSSGPWGGGYQGTTGF
jgi:hypothetical protein